MTRPRRPQKKASPRPAQDPWRICQVDNPARLWRQGKRGRAGWWTSEPGVASPYPSYAEACKAIVAMLEDNALYASQAMAMEVK